MKKIFILLIFLPSLITAQSNAKKVTALFLGNSYTYVNNLPLLIANLASANGDTLVYDYNTPGGYTLNNHFNDLTSKAKISSASWKYVILQAQSQEPSFSPYQVFSQTIPYARKLDSLIKLNSLGDFIDQDPEVREIRKDLKSIALRGRPAGSTAASVAARKSKA